jgi:hypothetical protein
MPLVVGLCAAIVCAMPLGCPPEPNDASEYGERAPQCPAGSTWDNYRCVADSVACPDGSSWDHGKCVALPSPVSDPLVGAWSVEGAQPTGSTYTGDAAISKSGDAFHIIWSIGGQSYSGVGVRRGDIVSVGWSDGEDHGVVDFDAKGDGTLNGTWFDAKGDKPGREVLAGGTPSLPGVYSITQGIAPDGTSYTGTCDLAVTGELHTLVWHVGKATFRGFGIRSGPVLSVGFSTAPTGNFGVIQYRVVGNKLVGRWAEWSQKVVQLGRETLVKK